MISAAFLLPFLILFLVAVIIFEYISKKSLSIIVILLFSAVLIILCRNSDIYLLQVFSGLHTLIYALIIILALNFKVSQLGFTILVIIWMAFLLYYFEFENLSIDITRVAFYLLVILTMKMVLGISK